MFPAGKRDQRVEIQTPTESVDAGGYGDVTPTWTRVAEVWAQIQTSGALEFYRASQTYSTMTHLVRILYRAGLSTKMRLKYGERYFGILGIINVDEASVELRLACSEAAADVTT